jgi:dCMP deaminase
MSKEDTNMLHAIAASWRSPDPNTQVGAAVINPERNLLVATGYNGWPRGIGSHCLSWEREGENPLDLKYTYVVHGEQNAIVNATGPIDGFHLYVTMYPCNECAKDIIQAGITEIIYLTNPYKDTWSTQAAAKMFKILDMDTRQHEWNTNATVPYLQSLLEQIQSKQ